MNFHHVNYLRYLLETIKFCWTRSTNEKKSEYMKWQWMIIFEFTQILRIRKILGEESL
jgi:hypothetical protein